ncbi:uncharacterized protein [Antedon mediterranea]
MDSRGFAIPYVDNGGPAVFSSNSSHVQRNSYRQPLRSSYTRSYQLHPTIPEVLPPSTPPPPPPLPPLRSNFHPTRNLYKPVSIKRPSVKQQRQPPAPPPPPPPPTTMAYIHPLPSPRSMTHPTQPPPPPPESSLSSSSSTTNEDQHRSMEDMIDAAGPPDYDSDSDNAEESDEGDDNNESSTNRDSEVEDTPSERVEQETETQTQNFSDDENDDGNDDSGNDQNDFDNDENDDRNEEGSGIDQNEGEQTVITHDAGVGTDDIDRPPSRHVTIHENHNDLGWQRRSQRSQMEWDEVEAPWARLSGRQLSGKRFRDDRQHPRYLPPPRKEPRVEDRSKHRRENHYHVHESSRNGNIVDPRLPIINSVYSRPYPDNGVHKKRNKPRAMYYDNPQFINERTIRYEPRQTYIPPQNEMMYQQQRRLVDTRRKPKKEKSTLAACTGCCVIMLLTFAFLVLVALCAVLAYYYVVFDENTTNHPCSSRPSVENGRYADASASATNTVGDQHVFECNNGYSTDPDPPFITCESDLTWDYKPLCIIPNDDLSNEEIGLLAGAIGAGVLALLFLIIMILMTCVNLFSSRNDQYKI